MAGSSIVRTRPRNHAWDHCGETSAYKTTQRPLLYPCLNEWDVLVWSIRLCNSLGEASPYKVTWLHRLTTPCEILHPLVWGTSVNSLALILKTINLFLPCKLIFWKSYQSWWPSKFSKVHISVVGNPSTTILCRVIIRTTLNIFFNTLHILQKRHQKR